MTTSMTTNCSVSFHHNTNKFGILKSTYACVGTKQYRNRRWSVPMVCNVTAALYWYDTSLYLALILYVVIISHVVWCILRWIKDKYKLHYIYLFTLEIHCSTIRVKHFLTHHLSTANSQLAVALTVQDSHTTAGCCCCTSVAAHTRLIPMHS